MSVKHRIGDSVTYVYTFKDSPLDNIMHDCRSYDEACSWAVVYERSGKLLTWGQR